MACKYIRNKNNNITSAIAPNGQRSKLFDSLATATGNVDSARSVYENLYTKRGKELYGADFENFEKSQDFLTTDDNGEPILAAGNGFYYILKKTWNLSIENSHMTPISLYRLLFEFLFVFPSGLSLDKMFFYLETLNFHHV